MSKMAKKIDLEYKAFEHKVFLLIEYAEKIGMTYHDMYTFGKFLIKTVPLIQQKNKSTV